MKKSFLTAVFGLITALAFAQPDREIDSVMQIAFRRGIFNGNLLVLHRGQVVVNRSYGYARADKSVLLTRAFRFDIGSVSKEFNGVGILLLQEAGKLSLDDPLSRYLALPEWSKSVKIRHLIQYTSGLPEALNQLDEAGTWNWIRGLKKTDFPPGEGYLYTHTNVFLQQKIIEKVSGLTYNRFVEERMLKPAGMTQTVVDLPLNDPTCAQGFSNDFVPLKYETRTTGWVRPTATDLARWLKALHSYRLISAESLRTLSQAYGFGESSLGTVLFRNDTLLSHYHQGSNHGFEGMIYRNGPEDITIIELTNNQNMRVGALRGVIESILLGKTYVIPRKSLYLDIREKLLADFDKGMACLDTLRQTKKEIYDFEGEKYELFVTGKFLLRRGRLDHAIALFQRSAQLFGDSPERTNPLEFIGQCYQKKGNTTEALTYFGRAADADPGNRNAKASLENLKKAAP